MTAPKSRGGKGMANLSPKRKAAVRKWQLAGAAKRKGKSGGARNVAAIKEFKSVYRSERSRGASKPLARVKAYDAAGMIAGKGNRFYKARVKVEEARLLRSMKNKNWARWK